MNTHKTILLLSFSVTLFSLVITSCKKESKCYDENLYQQHKDDFCTADCPGVIGLQ